MKSVHLKILINNTEIQQKNLHQNFRSHFDEDFNWKEHVMQVAMSLNQVKSEGVKKVVKTACGVRFSG